LGAGSGRVRVGDGEMEGKSERGIEGRLKVAEYCINWRLSKK